MPANLNGISPWLTIVPCFSGYRDQQTQKMVLTTEYVDVIDQYKTATEGSDNSMSIAENVFRKSIRTEDIEICGIFIPEIWQRFLDSSKET